MNAVAEKIEPKERQLTLRDRCDSCQAAAYVQVTGVTGSLTFCGHHYTKIMNDPVGSEKMKSFAYEIIDERDFLLGENRAKES